MITHAVCMRQIKGPNTTHLNENPGLVRLGSPEQVKTMKGGLAKPGEKGIEAMED